MNNKLTYIVATCWLFWYLSTENISVFPIMFIVKDCRAAVHFLEQSVAVCDTSVQFCANKHLPGSAVFVI